MNLKVFQFLSFIGLVLCLSCTTPKLIRPIERYIDMKEQAPSVVHLPLELSRQDIETTVNKLINGVVYEDKDMKDDGLMIRAEKSQDIEVEMLDQEFRYTVPLEIWIKKDIGLTNVRGKGEIAIKLSTKYEISSDWKINTETKVLDYEWLEKPKIRVAFVDIPIQFIADKVIKESKKVLSKSLDQQLASNFDLREYIQQGWDLIQSPVLVSEAYKLWVKIEPEVVAMTPLKVKGDSLISNVMIEARTYASIGEQPKLEKLNPLPSFNINEIEKDHFLVQLGTTISYKEAEHLAKQQLLGETFTSGRRSVTIEDIELYGQDTKLVINVQLSGSYTGSVYMIGTPVFNVNKNQIEFEDLDFELNTKDVLAQSIGWLFRRGLEKRFRKAMKFPIKENLDEIKNLIQENLQNYPITQNVILNGQLKDIEVFSTHLSKEYIHIIFQSEGKLSLLIKGL